MVNHLILEHVYSHQPDIEVTAVEGTDLDLSPNFSAARQAADGPTIIIL